jgi:hypothetical protein
MVQPTISTIFKWLDAARGKAAVTDGGTDCFTISKTLPSLARQAHLFTPSFAGPGRFYAESNVRPVWSSAGTTSPEMEAGAGRVQP